MKQFQCQLFFIVLFLTTSWNAHAQGQGNTAPGLSGKIQAGAFFLQTDSQLSTADSGSRNDDLDGPAGSHEEILPLASLLLRYRFKNGTAVYVGNPLEVGEGLAVAAGVIKPLGAGALDVSLTWLPIEEVWKNPYQTGAARQESDVDNYGLRIKWQQIGGTPWELSYKGVSVEVDDDEIGRIENDLKRNGWTHELGVKYTHALGKGLNLRPEFSYTYSDIEGASNRYQGVKVGALLQRIRPPWVLIGLISGEYNQYEKTHPLFNKRREAFGCTTFAQIIRLNLFGVEQLFGSVAAGYVWSDANIDFFDSKTLIGLASIGFDFN